MSLSIFLLGLQLYFKAWLLDLTDQNVFVDSILPVALLFTYMFAFGIGPATIPWTLQGELVPPKVRKGENRPIITDGVVVKEKRGTFSQC